MVSSEMTPDSIRGMILSLVRYTPLGHSRSRPPFTAPDVEYTEVQSDMRMPSKPHMLRRTSTFI